MDRIVFGVLGKVVDDAIDFEYVAVAEGFDEFEVVVVLRNTDVALDHSRVDATSFGVVEQDEEFVDFVDHLTELSAKKFGKQIGSFGFDVGIMFAHVGSNPRRDFVVVFAFRFEKNASGSDVLNKLFASIDRAMFVAKDDDT